VHSGINYMPMQKAISRMRLFKPGVRALIMAFCCVLGFAAQEPDFTNQAEAAYKAAQDAYARKSSSPQAAVDLARTAFDYADIAPNDVIREQVANHGIATARAAIAAHTNCVGAHYYLALDIGQLARTKMWGALKLLTEMERELKYVIQHDPKYDYAGGHRTIGVLYSEAPGWPTSVGDRKKARYHLEKAVEIAPEYPENHICYMEALVKWKEWKALTDELADYQTAVAKAKEKFTGADWAYDWYDWSQREKLIQQRISRR
jgi:hypothetical protein